MTSQERLLSKILKDDYKIVMVGLPKEMISRLPDNIIGLERTENKEQLVEFYNIAGVFLNPTHEDNYPTVNLEALAFGLPVVTYETGGSTEMIEGNGIVVERKNVNSIYEAMKNISFEKKVVILSEDMDNNYIDLYNLILNK